MLGAVLVGGRSRRMGADKALLDWHGKPLAIHVGERLRQVCREVVLVGGAGRGYERLGLPWWPDPPGLEGAGPMAGLVAVLRHAPAVVLAACDLPHLDPRVLGRLIAAAGEASAAMPVVEGRVEPLVGVYRRPIVGVAQASIAARSGKMTDLLQAPGTRVIPGERLGPPEEVARCFKNLNSPKDMA